MRIASSLLFLAALAATNLRASFALRGSFLLQTVFMLVNNLTFFAIWLIFFDRFEEVGGWRLEDMATVYAVVAAGYGIAAVMAGGIQFLGQSIVDGHLDPLLVQPRSALVQSIGSRSNASGWGDILTGAGFLAIIARDEPAVLLLAPLAIAGSALAFGGVGVAFQSLAFWAGRSSELSRQLSEFTLNFSLYPRPLFGGAVRLVLFSLLPAAFVGWLPVEAVREPGWQAALAALTGAAGMVFLAALIFARGLKRYESGSRFGAAA